MLEVIKKKKTLRDKFLSLKNSISKDGVKTPRNVSKFVFLCGANATDTISARRKAIMKFAEKNLPGTQFFIAEKMFSVLQEEGKEGNMLDIENEILEFTDNIVVVLESPSSFAELGAFSHNSELRKKLIVINDSKFRDSKSFINMGPIKAIEETSGKDYIISYKMNEDGVCKLDAIGDTYAPLSKILEGPAQTRLFEADLGECNPATNFSKKSAMMVHDLVYFSGPVNHKELVEILLLIFGKHNFKVKEHAAILVAVNSLERTKEGFYKSLLRKPYYKYSFDTNSLISTCRNYMLKFCPDRIHGH